MCVITRLEYKNDRHPLRQEMHRDRATQFKQRMKWPVSIDENGEEHDEYDTLGAQYVIATKKNGGHAGSLRLIPISMPTMLYDHFPSLLHSVDLREGRIWECTRFCLSPNLTSKEARIVISNLLTNAAEFGLENKIDAYVGIFDRRMLRVYQNAGSIPIILNEIRHRSGIICLGRWNLTVTALRELRNKQPKLAVQY